MKYKSPFAGVEYTRRNYRDVKDLAVSDYIRAMSALAGVEFISVPWNVPSNEAIVDGTVKAYHMTVTDDSLDRWISVLRWRT